MWFKLPGWPVLYQVNRRDEGGNRPKTSVACRHRVTVVMTTAVLCKANAVKNLGQVLEFGQKFQPKTKQNDGDGSEDSTLKMKKTDSELLIVLAVAYNLSKILNSSNKLCSFRFCCPSEQQALSGKLAELEMPEW